MAHYNRRLRGGGSRIIAREGDGRFHKPVLDVEVCAHCGQLVRASFTEERFPVKVWPEKCPSCDRDWRGE